MIGARIRLACLWVSQTARVAADNCLRMFAVRVVASVSGAAHDAAWHQVTPFFILPFVLLAPVNGALSNDLPKRRVLVGSAGFCLIIAGLAVCWPGLTASPWGWCAVVGATSLGAAVYSPTRFALFPPAADDTLLPLSRVNGLMEIGGAGAVIAGLVLGLSMPLAGPERLTPWSAVTESAAGCAAALNLLGLLTALPATFPSDRRRSEPPAQAITGFFRDSARVWRDQPARASLLALAGYLALITTGSGVVLTYTGGLRVGASAGGLEEALLMGAAGVAGGAWLAGVESNLRRGLGIVPLAVTGLLAALAWAYGSTGLRWPAFVLGVTGGLVTVPLRAFYQAIVPADARGNAMAVMNSATYGLTSVLAVAMFGLARAGVLTLPGQLLVLAMLAGAGAALAWRVLFRESLELVLEILAWPFYRIRARGPGVASFPLQGPTLVVANHSAWMDPVWLAKVLPRRLTPMMTSVFFDLPGLRWLMVHIVHAIRVEASTFRREAPELNHAIAALDRGECVLLFPEGYMRRRVDRPLRLFGQGIWHILRERPQTPVVTCWIEGGWGSYFSYQGGPPTKNKRLDWWRRIEIGISPPVVLDATLLADPWATRTFLARACLHARHYLDVAPLETDEASAEAALAIEGDEEPAAD